MPRPEVLPYPPARLPSLTGLRFAAALGVFLFHGQSLLPGWPVLRPLLAGGQSGVSFFFVLSGFVLTWSVGDRCTAARLFWRRRAARVLPAYLITWLIGIPVSWLTFGAWPSATALLGTGTLTQSWFDDKSVFFGVNGVGWSLSCEVLFYALFPALLPVVRRLGRQGLLGAAAGCVAVQLGLSLAGLLVAGPTVGDPTSAAFWWVTVLPVSRLPEFLLGMLAACAVARSAVRTPQLRVAAPVAVGAAGVAGLFPSAAVAGWVTALPFALLICAAAKADLAGAAGVLGGRWCVLIGTWSYAFYLTHQLVLRVSASLWPVTGMSWLQLLVDAVAAVAVSAGLFRFVERPGERRWSPARPALSSTGSGGGPPGPVHPR